MAARSTFLGRFLAVEGHAPLVWSFRLLPTHLVQEFSFVSLLDHIFKCLLQTNIVLCRRLVEANSILLGQQLALLSTYLPVVY